MEPASGRHYLGSQEPANGRHYRVPNRRSAVGTFGFPRPASRHLGHTSPYADSSSSSLLSRRT
jgi:hypothetical protein